MGAIALWIRGLAAAFGLAAFAHGAGAATLSLAEARVLAEQAYAQGNIPQAHALASALVKARPEEPEALLLLAATQALLGQSGEAKTTGRQAYKLAETPELKHQAAQVISRSALQEGHYGAAQLWLRRAYQSADDESDRDHIAQAFRRLRNASPISARFDFRVAPSSNINGGTENRYHSIDGENLGGILTGSSRALSGTTATVVADLSFRLGQNARHYASFDLLVVRTFNTLSDEAKDRAPDAKGSDFDYAYVEIGLTQRMADVAWYMPDHIGLSLGQSWSGGDVSRTSPKLTLSRRFALSERTSLRVTGEWTEHLSMQNSEDQRVNKLRLDLNHRIKPGSLQFGVTRTAAHSDDINSTYSQLSAQLGFTQAKAVKGIRFSGYVGWTETTYDKHTTAAFNVPARSRDDQAQRAGLSMHLDNVSYLGFTPVVSWTQEKRSSNFSRYETQSQGLSMSVRSSF